MRRIYGYRDMKKVVGIPSANFIGYNNYENREQRKQQKRENRRNKQNNFFAQTYRNTYANTYTNNNLIKYASNDPKIIYCMEYYRTRNSKLYGQLNPNLNNRQMQTNNIIDFQSRKTEVVPIRKPQVQQNKSYTSRNSNIIYLREYAQTRNNRLYGQLNTTQNTKITNNYYSNSVTSNNNIRKVQEYRQQKATTEYQKVKSSSKQIEKQENIRPSSKKQEINTFKNSLKTSISSRLDKKSELDKACMELDKALRQRKKYEAERNSFKYISSGSSGYRQTRINNTGYRQNRRNTGFER